MDLLAHNAWAVVSCMRLYRTSEPQLQSTVHSGSSHLCDAVVQALAAKHLVRLYHVSAGLKPLSMLCAGSCQSAQAARER